MREIYAYTEREKEMEMKKKKKRFEIERHHTKTEFNFHVSQSIKKVNRDWDYFRKGSKLQNFEEKNVHNEN